VARSAAEQRDVALYLRGFKSDPIDYGVEGSIGECTGYGGGIFDVHG
jgi:hypothetical protein